MKRVLLLAALAATAPLACLAAPAVGDMIGTNAEAATAALKEKGCTVREFEVEDGKIEAKCTDAAGHRSEVYIDPKTGTVVKIKAKD